MLAHDALQGFANSALPNRNFAQSYGKRTHLKGIMVGLSNK